VRSQSRIIAMLLTLAAGGVAVCAAMLGGGFASLITPWRRVLWNLQDYGDRRAAQSV
jgi:hypothetical protein